MRPYTDAEIIARVESHAEGFTGWRDGIYDVWVRTRSDRADRFNDKVFTYRVRGGRPEFVMRCTGTSKTGRYGLLNFRLWNKHGAAVLKSDTIVYGYARFGYHKGKPAYRQIANWPHYRDGDFDRLAEERGTLHNGIIGANCHRAGWRSQTIGRWSVACLVRNVEAEFLRWLNFLRDEGYPPLNMAILKEF